MKIKLLLSKLLHNWGLKLASLVLAFVIWFLVVQIENPQDVKTFSNIKVNLTNVELLENENKVYDVLDNTDTVRVSVRAPRRVLESLRASDIVAEADMSKLTDINTIAISYYVMSTEVDSTAVNSIWGNNDVVRLNVEEKADVSVSLVPQTSGDVAEGYTLGNITMDLNRVEVSGPKSAVEQVSYAGVNIDVKDATSAISANVEILLYDREGNEVRKDNITKQTDYTHVNVEVLAVKEVPVEIDYVGVPAQGYMITGAVECNPRTIQIAGSVSAIANVNKISIIEDAVDITGANSDVVRNINVREYLPDNVRLADSSSNGQVTVTIYIEPVVEKYLQVPVGNLTFTNVPEGLVATLPEDTENCQVSVKGLGELITPLRGNDIIGTIDVEKWMEEENITHLNPGTYYIPVTFEFADGVEQISSVTLHVAMREDDDE